MPIEDHLGYDREETSLGTLVMPHALSHGPDEVCAGGTDYPDKEIVTIARETFGGEEYCVKYCRGCGKQWWKEYEDSDGEVVDV